MLLGQLAEVGPQGIELDVGDDHGLTPVCRGPTGADALSDRDAIDRFVVGVRQARGGAAHEVPAIWAEQTDRRDRLALRDPLDNPDHLGQHRLERLPSRDHRHHVALSGDQLLVDHALADVL